MIDVMKKMFSKASLLVFMTGMAMSASVASAKTYRSFDTDCKGLKIVTDSVDYRSDLTRYYVRLIGEPHTSQRIDRITLESAGVPFASTDIEGVDMERWFQWEEDGSIPVEIDFPAMKAAKTVTIKVEGPRGVSLWTVTRQ